MDRNLIIIIATLILSSSISAMMTGGWRERNPNESDVKKYSQKASDKISESMNFASPLQVLNICKAKSQIVSGIKYKIIMQVAMSPCNMNSSTNDSEVNVLECEGIMTCSVIIWDRPWMLNGTEILEQNCEQGKTTC